MDWNEDDRITQVDTLVPPAPSQAEALPRDRGLLSVLNGPMRGLCFKVHNGVILGRGREAQALLPHPALSRRHARVFRGKKGFYIEDLGSRNGTYMGDDRVAGAIPIFDGARLRLGAEVLLRFVLVDVIEERAILDLHRSALVDPLTGAYNRGVLFDRLEGEWSFAIRHRTSLSVAVLDLDHFKAVNDKYGHQAGDAVLRIVAASVRRLIRREDLLARYGGEEFVVVARGTSLANGAIMAERIRKCVSDLTIPWQGADIHLTVSVGVASLNEGVGHSSVGELLAAADHALYAAKARGRNQVVQS
jgi:diguanylate cyclase (GGDEF)-like protein